MTSYASDYDTRPRDDDEEFDDDDLATIGSTSSDGGSTVTPPPDGNPIYTGGTSPTGTEPPPPTGPTDGNPPPPEEPPPPVISDPLDGMLPTSGDPNAPNAGYGTTQDPGTDTTDQGDGAAGGEDTTGSASTGEETTTTRDSVDFGPDYDPLTPKEISNAAPYTPYEQIGQTDRNNPLQGQTTDYVSDWLASPSRYDIDVVQQSMDVIQQRMDDIRRRGFNQGQEYLASMGMLGGTRAGEMQDLRRAEYDLQEQGQLADLMREMARTQGQDRAMAFDAAMRQQLFGEDQHRYDQDYGFRERNLGEQSRQFGASLSEQARQFAESLGFSYDQLAEGSRQYANDDRFRKATWGGEQDLKWDELDWRKQAERNRNLLSIGNSLGWEGDYASELMKLLGLDIDVTDRSLGGDPDYNGGGNGGGDWGYGDDEEENWLNRREDSRNYDW